MAIRLVAVDMDGTLLDSHKRLPSDFIPWVREHPQICVVIASGRQYAALMKDLSELRNDVVFIAENGGLVFEKDKLIHSDAVPFEKLRRSLDELSSIPDIYAVLCGAKSAYMKPAPDHIKAMAGVFYTRLAYAEDLYECAKEDLIVKIALYVGGGREEEVYRRLRDSGGPLWPVLSGGSWIGLANQGTSKGEALKAVQRRYGVGREESMAFGDYLNDYTLLQNCGESYCMANGHPELKAAARHLTASNDDDGVMKVLRKL